jgi:eukaryotic-like serine/threonine-protein kinase
MSLTPGSRFGPYEIISPLGAGGMGEVYRARDSRLMRDAAIKVLPPAFTDYRERLERFEREAQLLARLHHPNIASVFGLEESTGVLALVMELVEGEDLSTRMARGPIPLDEALPIATQIAAALEVAHEHGIIHRDLKPANVKVRTDGAVKVLDFGLAKALAPDASASADVNVAHSPTLTVRDTRVGTILGTAAYMAPEQARGRPVDRRADIWAFGLVLYEMLTGRRAFAGEDRTEILAAVLRQEMDWKALPAGTPPQVQRLLERCLDRDARRRLRDIGEARVVLEDLAREPSHIDDRSGPPADVPSPGRWKAARPLAVAAALAVLALGFAIWRVADGILGSTPAAGAPPIAFERLTFQPGHFVTARFAPDGQTVFLSAAWRGAREIFQVRPQAGELPVGLANAELLSVSRTGELALLLPRVQTGNPYVTYGTLAVVSASGGTPRELAENVSAADWAPDGVSLAALCVTGSKQRVEYPLGTPIYESPSRAFLIRVSRSGDSVAFFELDASDLWSVVLVDRSGKRQILSKDWADWWSLTWSPDGREIWFSAARAGVASNLYAVDRSGKLRTLYSAPGTLVLHDATAASTALVAQVTLQNQVLGRPKGETSERDLSWLEGSNAVDLSADGRKLLLRVTSEREPGRTAVFLRSMDGSSPVRLGYGLPQELSPDGNWALATRGGLVVAMPTAAGKERTIETGFPMITAARWLPDSDRVLVLANDAQGRSVASVMSFSGGGTRQISESLELRFASWGNRPLSPVSPDGRFVAAAVASGEVLLVSLNGGASKVVAGSGPSEIPIQWTADGRGLLLFNPATLPARISEIDLESGRRQLVRELLPVDRVGVYGIMLALITPDRSAYAYGYQRYRSELYRVTGLR